jgi:hypothetical protein
MAAGCMDLDVTNINEPDYERALATAGDVEALIKASYNSWFSATYYGESSVYVTPGFFLSQQAFQNAVPWTNFGMEEYSKIPRVGIRTDPTWTYFPVQRYAWERSYQALSALASGLKAMEDSAVARAIGDSLITRNRAYGKLVQGLAHSTVALLYDRGFIVDETTDLEGPQTPVEYGALMDRALTDFDEAIDIATGVSFTLPSDWMQAEVDAEKLVQLAHSYKARLRAQVARTPAERELVDWAAIQADVDAGLQETHNMDMNWYAGWWNIFLEFSMRSSWSQLPYFIYGMADTSGTVAEWYALPTTAGQAAGGPAKSHLLSDGRPVLIVTPDLRFPQGATVEEQRVNQSDYVRIATPSEVGGTWAYPDRETWGWSWYKGGPHLGRDYAFEVSLVVSEIPLAEMRLLKAEALYWAGDRAGAAAIVNETRTPAGLNPTDASGTNTSCVPRLPDGSCGDLWEMLKWEKRMETAFRGIAGAGWFFDSRGWGDLYKDTPLQMPIPCSELETLGFTPCNTYGGPGGEMSAPVSTYHFPWEG